MGTQTWTMPLSRDGAVRRQTGGRLWRMLPSWSSRRVARGVVRLLLALMLALPTVLAGGSARTALAAAGDLDPTFGTDGKVTTDSGQPDTAAALAVQADGKLVAAGGGFGILGQFKLARYLPSGALDPSFGTGGKVVRLRRQRAGQRPGGPAGRQAGRRGVHRECLSFWRPQRRLGVGALPAEWGA